MTTLTHYELINLDEEREMEHDAAPCPFCGSERVEFVTTNQTSYTSHYAVTCVTCDARGPAKREYAQAVDGWNKADRCFSVTPVANADAVRALQARLKLADDLVREFVLDLRVLTPQQREAWEKWTGKGAG